MRTPDTSSFVNIAPDNKMGFQPVSEPMDDIANANTTLMENAAARVTKPAPFNPLPWGSTTLSIC